MQILKDHNFSTKVKIRNKIDLFYTLKDDQSRTHLREISDERLLVSLHHSHYRFADLEVFDLKKKGRATKIYSLGRVLGCNH